MIPSIYNPKSLDAIQDNTLKGLPRSEFNNTGVYEAIQKIQSELPTGYIAARGSWSHNRKLSESDAPTGIAVGEYVHVGWVQVRSHDPEFPLFVNRKNGQ